MSVRPGRLGPPRDGVENAGPQQVRTNPASRGTETSAEVLVSVRPGRLSPPRDGVENAGPQQVRTPYRGSGVLSVTEKVKRCST